jgi:hypothetical protein
MADVEVRRGDRHRGCGRCGNMLKDVYSACKATWISDLTSSLRVVAVIPADLLLLVVPNGT